MIEATTFILFMFIIVVGALAVIALMFLIACLYVKVIDNIDEWVGSLAMFFGNIYPISDL